MHWADVIAERLAEQGDSHVVATGITPSGPIHVGNMREVLTADLVVRACERIGVDAELIYIADTADPLRKVYPFLNEQEYGQHVGKALATLPSPDGEGSYPDYFLSPFFSALDDLGVEYRVVDVHAAYLEGKYTESVKTAIDNRVKIRDIISEVSQRPLDDDWFPYNPTDDEGKMHGIKVTNCDWPWVEWVSEDGRTGRTNIEKGGGKLPWRLDWAARWHWLDITFEGYGKDHSAAGGSWDTGQHLAPIFGSDPPMGMMYEWIYLKGKGAMASSKGNTVSGKQLLDIVPPEIMRYLITRVKPSKHIDFDPGEGLISLADEYERLEQRYHSKLSEIVHKNLGESSRKEQQLIDEARKFELAQGIRSGTDYDSSLGISFSHLSTLCQIKSQNEDLLASLARTHGVDVNQPDKRLVDRVKRMRNWVDSEWFPGNARIQLADSINSADFTSNELEFLQIFSEMLANSEWVEDSLLATIREAISNSTLEPRQAFTTLYQALLKRDRGPKLAALLVELGQDNVNRLLDQLN
ncbi:MAG TPA: lysine--tRNA ligase [Candidatus Poseidoniales archaeon]|nr:MAG: lysine--tRNA ligase [Euryarchaeota archaeon]HHZ74238.1 lysine--tRNA ligase [Candidatus Poseidoniales archaeon]PXY75988.1 MAG: lysine--tRNA ligase [Euryarchaeota archaeon]PXY77191.1 MAG: lysine--tRNA ligase [Euryarchaeota archaeon]PXY79247.1 MAG: lysine--tRNA ligase [Euryarchaeota archaeon]